MHIHMKHKIRVAIVATGAAIAMVMPVTAFAVIGAACTPTSAACQGAGMPAVPCGAGETCNLPGAGGCNGTCIAGGGAASVSNRLVRPTGPLRILQPLWPVTGSGYTDTLPAAPNIQVAFNYIQRSWPWIIGVAAAFAVIQAIVGGIQIMFSSGSKEAGVTRITWAAAGLMLIALSGFILTTINPLFYR